jgi:hypothetical protein
MRSNHRSQPTLAPGRRAVDAQSLANQSPPCISGNSAKYLPMPTISARKGNVKSRAIRMIRELPKSSSWDDLMYRIYVRQKIEAGLGDFAAGRVHSHDSIRREFGVA